MNPASYMITPISLLILSSLLLFQSPESVQSISLSRLCGSYGHSCFGANWGKRGLPYKSSSSSESFSSDLNEKQRTIKDKSISNHALEELRLKLSRQRSRQLFGLQ